MLRDVFFNQDQSVLSWKEKKYYVMYVTFPASICGKNNSMLFMFINIAGCIVSCIIHIQQNLCDTFQSFKNILVW